MTTEPIPEALDAGALLAAAAPNVSKEALANIERWLTRSEYASFVPEIADLIARRHWSDLDESFYTVLPFGTGGRRGPRGVGPNRVNARTIAESARGLTDWVLGTVPAGKASIVIAWDTRHASVELSRVCAEVIAAAGVTALLFEGFRPTPQLSFTVRSLGASAGIVVSASHNPRTDNGFKAYGPSGGQLVPPLDAEVMAAVAGASNGVIPSLPLEEGLASGAVRILGAEADQAYQQAVVATGMTHTRGARIVYTPLHGAGTRSVPPVLSAAGFRELHLVESQASPDGDFPNVAGNIPNPEEPAALAQAGEMARRLDADIAIGTDPDADRLGCVAKRHGHQPTWAPLTGNQIGAILCHHVLSELMTSGRITRDTLVLTTAVTSPMIGKIARSFGANVIEDLLVGFKYIAAVIESLPDPGRLAFACEESHGYLAGAYTRDKDGAGAALLLAEAAATDRAASRGLWDRLAEIHKTVGYHCDLLHAHLSPGKDGMAHVARMMAGLRERPPCRLGGLEVTLITDRSDDTIRDSTGAFLRDRAPTSDPVSGAEIVALRPARDNLLVFDLRGDRGLEAARAAVRPSGTEPKCKFYASAWTSPRDCSVSDKDVDAVTAAIREDLLRYALDVA